MQLHITIINTTQAVVVRPNVEPDERADDRFTQDAVNTDWTGTEGVKQIYEACVTFVS